MMNTYDDILRFQEKTQTQSFNFKCVPWIQQANDVAQNEILRQLRPASVPQNTSQTFPHAHVSTVNTKDMLEAQRQMAKPIDTLSTDGCTSSSNRFSSVLQAVSSMKVNEEHGKTVSHDHSQRSPSSRISDIASPKHSESNAHNTPLDTLSKRIVTCP